MIKHIDQATLKSILDYNELTGLFTWRISVGTAMRGSIAGSVSTSNGGYRKISIGGTDYSAHRLAFIWMLGEAPDEVDHRNRIRSDNRWANLRPATNAQNVRNSKVRCDNILGVRGVSFRNGKYVARVTPITGPIILGRFNTIEEAIAFVEKHRRIEHGEFAYTEILD